MNIGNAIRTCRQTRQLRQSEVAEHAGISNSYLSLLERGLRTDPSVQTLQRVADALGVSLAVLIVMASEKDERVLKEEPAVEALSRAAEGLLKGASE